MSVNTKKNLAYKSSWHADQARKDSFKAILGELEGRRAQIFQALLHYGPLSNQEIADLLHIPLQSVTGRVYELRGYLWSDELRKSVLHEDKFFVEFDSYVAYRDADKKQPVKSRGIRWRVTDKALAIEKEFEFA